MNKQLIHCIPNQIESSVIETRNTKTSQSEMIMNKGFINELAIIAAGCLSLSTLLLPPPARSQETTQPCEVGILNAKKRIQQGRDIFVITGIEDGTKRYPDHPNGRPIIILLEVDGNAAEEVMASPVFQKAIASEIIKSCNSVGAVTFIRYQTHWVSTVGLMKDGSIQYFECIEYDPEGGSPSWGQERCDL